VCVYERERECVCVCGRERERERVSDVEIATAVYGKVEGERKTRV